MRKVLAYVFWLLVVGFWQSCSHQEPTPEELAGKAAKEYYDFLLAGDYEKFLSGKENMDSVSNDYRIQMLSVCEKYRQELEQLHDGIATVTVSNVRRDSTLQLVHALLLLHFKDSVKEEITVPMVQRDGQWKMR